MEEWGRLRERYDVPATISDVPINLVKWYIGTRRSPVIDINKGDVNGDGKISQAEFAKIRLYNSDFVGYQYDKCIVPFSKLLATPFKNEETKAA